MIKMMIDSKINRATPECRNSTQVCNARARVNQFKMQISRYARVSDEDKHNTQLESKPRESLKHIRITISNHNLRQVAASKGNLKSLDIKESITHQGKSTSPPSNYNQIKMKRLRRERKKTDQTNQTSCQTLEPLGLHRKNVESIQNLDHSLEEGSHNKHVMKNYISQLQQVLGVMNQKQNTERKGVQAETNTVKKRVETTRNKQSFRNSLKLIMGPRARQTIDEDSQQSQLKRRDDCSEASLMDTQQVRHTSNQQIHRSIITSIINKTKQQRKVLNLKDVRQCYKQEQSVNKSNNLIEYTTKKHSSDKKQSPQHTNSYRPNSRKFIYPSRTSSKTIEVSGLPQPAHQVSNIIEEEDSKIQVSNFSSPLHLPKGKIQTQKFHLDISVINKQEQVSIDSISNRELFDLTRHKQPQGFNMDRKPENRKKKLVDLQKLKKNFPVGFFDA